MSNLQFWIGYLLGAAIIEVPLTGAVTRVIRWLLRATTLPKTSISLLTFLIASALLTILEMQGRNEGFGQLPPNWWVEELFLGIWLMIDLLVLDRRAGKKHLVASSGEGKGLSLDSSRREQMTPQVPDKVLSENPVMTPERRELVTAQMKRCPYCSEEIRSAAIKCRFCGEWLKDAVEKSLRNS
ncbi:MAG: hypothetical protein ACREBG_05740 [Pyrinomonadaceae bacterium]